MNLYLIANPHARNGRGRSKLEAVCHRLENRGVRFELALCNGLADATRLSREANLAGRDTIVAAGGDGTINRVLNGFFDPAGKRLSTARLGVVHIGTSPDFCRSYGIPTSVEAAVETLIADVTRPIPVGRITCLPDEHPQSTRPAVAFFGCCANLGLGAAVARGANGGIRRCLGDFLGTFVSLLRALASFRPRRLRLTLDDKSTELDGVCNLAVGKTQYIASGLRVRHTLQPQDPRFYVLCVRNLSLLKLGAALRTVYSGQVSRAGNSLSLTYAQRIRVEPTDAAVEVEFDGDPAGFCPCQIQTAADSLDLLTRATP